jgi:Arc/MetJ-type ribon-helix-helix transcriptional regulator
MKVVTLRLPENTVEELDDEYSQEGFDSRTEYVRNIIENRDAIPQNTPENTDRLDELTSRVDGLEERVDALDAGDKDPGSNWTRDPHCSEPIVDDTDQEDHEDRRDDLATEQLRQSMLDVLEDLDVPGRRAGVEKTRREAVKHAWDRLREQGSATSQGLANDTFGAFFDEELGYSTSARYPGYGLWDNCVRDRLKQLPGVEAPGRRGNEWRFVGR